MFKKLFITIFLSIFFNSLIPYLINSSAYAYTEKTYYIHQDNVGSVVATTDENGNLVDENSYGSYGKKASDTVKQHDSATVKKNITEREYTGQIKDNTTNLQYYNARYYDPILSRFISGDQVQGENRYAYVGGNPISFSDPTGNKMDAGGDSIGGGGSYTPPINTQTAYPGYQHADSLANDENSILRGKYAQEFQIENENSGGYDSKYFNDLVDSFAFNNEMPPYKFAQLPTNEKMDYLSKTIYENIPYDPVSAALQLYDYKNPIKTYDEHITFTKLWGKNDYDRAISSAVQRQKNLLFICLDFARLYAVQTERLVPEVTTSVMYLPAIDHAVARYRINKYMPNLKASEDFVVDVTKGRGGFSYQDDKINHPEIYKDSTVEIYDRKYGKILDKPIFILDDPYRDTYSFMSWAKMTFPFMILNR